MQATTDFGDELTSRTSTYVGKLNDCVGLLPELLEQYAAGGDYQETIDRIQSLEGECDRRTRELSTFIANAGPGEVGLRHARIHLNAPSLLELYQELDELANLAEGIAEELHVMSVPATADCFQGLREMAACATEAMATLDRVVTQFVYLLCTPEKSGTISDGIVAIRDSEDTCDRLRNGVISAAFSDEAVSRPLTFRQFAISFDELVDQMEDLTDLILVIASNEPDVTTDPRRDHPRQAR